jgi:hypothetical protein
MNAPRPGLRRTGFLHAYYWATPAFAALDLLVGVPLRAAALPDPYARLAYYAFCLGCAALLQLRPRAAAIVALAESSVNIMLLILSVYLPVIGVLDLAETGDVGGPQLTPIRLANFALSGFVLYRAFLASEYALSRRP